MATGKEGWGQPAAGKLPRAERRRKEREARRLPPPRPHVGKRTPWQSHLGCISYGVKGDVLFSLLGVKSEVRAFISLSPVKARSMARALLECANTLDARLAAVPPAGNGGAQ